MTKLIDLQGQRFGRLTVLHRSGTAANGNALWLCQCDCGNRIVGDAHRLRTGATRSCGCLRRETSRARIQAQPETVAKMKAPITESIRPGMTMRMSLRNRSGVTGVSWDASTEKWVARLMVRGRYVLNEQYDSFRAAVAARRSAEAHHGIKPRLPRGGCSNAG